MKLGVIVARFQTPYLHTGHIATINYAIKHSRKVAVFLGVTETRLTINNPFSFEIRKDMVKDRFPDVEVYQLSDVGDDKRWSKNLDNQLVSLFPDDTVTLYGSRGSFLDSYHGIFNKHFTKLDIAEVSATRIRSAIHGYVQNSVVWREGIIWASAHKYPVTYPTVDVAIINFDKKQLLLGKKKDESKWRFIGGFVDVNDESYEMAGKREVREECGDISTDSYKHIGSFPIDDWRYRKEADRIMTTFFCCHYIYGRVHPTDDIAELQWFDLSTVSEKDIEPAHHVLLEALKNYLPPAQVDIPASLLTPDTAISILLNSRIPDCGINEFPELRRGMRARALTIASIANIEYLHELVCLSKKQLLTVRNTGNGVLSFWEEFLKTKNLHFEFDVEKYGFAKQPFKWHYYEK